MSEQSPADGAWSYRAGAWFAVFGPEVTVLLPKSQRDQVIGLWSLVDSGAGFDEVLDGLLVSGLSRLPGFVLVSSDGGPTRILLRGTGVTATLRTAGEQVVLDGAAGGTWSERTVTDVTSLVVSVPDDDAAAGSADFPIMTGLVRVGRIDRPPATGSAAPAPAIEQEQPDEVPEPEVIDHPVADEPPAVPALDPSIPPPPAEPPPIAIVPDPPAEPPAVAVTPDESGLLDATEPPGPTDLPDFPEFPEEPPEPPVVRAGTGALSGSGPIDPLSAPLAEVEAEQQAQQPWQVVPESSADAADDAELPEELTGADRSWQPPVEDDPLARPPSQDTPYGWMTPWGGPEGSPDDPPPRGEHAAADPNGAAAPTDATSELSWFESQSDPVDRPGFSPPRRGLLDDLRPRSAGAAAADAPRGADHDGLTNIGGGDSSELQRRQPGIPGQPPAPAVTAPVAKLLISDGQTIVVDRVVLVGRAPEARRFTSTEQPLLVTVPSRLHEISSTHVEVRPGSGADHGTAVVSDMGSTNGTVLVQPGLGPEDLKPGIAVQLIPGAIINLGDGITIQVTKP